MLIIFDPAHGKDVAGKRMLLPPNLLQLHKGSPFVENGYFCEYLFSRKAIERIRYLLDYDPDYPYVTEITNPTIYEIGLKTRKIKMEKLKTMYNAQEFLVLSLHNNAVGWGERFYPAKGFSVWTTTGMTKSDFYATTLWKTLSEDFPDRKALANWEDRDPDFEQNFTVLTSSLPSVLVEWLFYTNEDDLAFLLDQKNFERYCQSIVKFCKKIL